MGNLLLNIWNFKNKLWNKKIIFNSYPIIYLFFLFLFILLFKNVILIIFDIYISFIFILEFFTNIKHK